MLVDPFRPGCAGKWKSDFHATAEKKGACSARDVLGS